MEWPDPPRKLYKYFSDNDNSLATVEKYEVYYASPRSFNDPFDCRTRFDLSGSHEQQLASVDEALLRNGVVDPDARQQRARAFLAKAQDDPATWEQIASGMRETIMDSSAVCCLSENCCNTLMFAHYGQGHRGFCLEFDAVGDSIFAKAKRVRYEESYPSVRYVTAPADRSEGFIETLLTKSPEWSYEKEWRLIRLLRNVRDATGQSPVGVYPFSPEHLTGVFFGALMQADRRDEIVERIRAGGSHPRLFQARPGSATYTLDIDPL